MGNPTEKEIAAVFEKLGIQDVPLGTSPTQLFLALSEAKRIGEADRAKTEAVIFCAHILLKNLDEGTYGPGPAMDALRIALKNLDEENDNN